MKHRKPTPAWQKLGLRVSKKLAVGATALATVFGGLAVASVSAQASTDRNSYADTVGNPTFEAAREQYGLTKEMKNGAILHAWMWSFNTITEHMDEIAEAGYTSIQTEPMSKIKVNDANGKKFTENWYYVYQPTNTSIGNFVVGSEDDLKAMTVAAHAHGIRIIVDVVANHFTADWNAIDSDWQKSEYFHARNSCSGSGGDNIDYSNRWQVTHCHLLGLWDLNTANPEVANRMHDFLKTAVNDGVDGFRFDAGKHVELPNEFDGSQYWTTILQNGSQYQYGEVLQGDSGLDYKAYANLYAKYGEGGGGATASDYGKTIRSALWSKNLNAGNLMSLRNGGVNDDQLVTWVESHDNYANSDKESTYLTNDQIRFGWAVVGARAGGAPLFFNRPKASGGNQPQFAEASQLGDAGDDMWKDTAVAAVNHFRNAMDGEAEYLRNCGSEQNNNSCLMVERYKTDNNAGNDGVSIANMGGDQNLAGTPTKLDDGTYTDQVNGGTITVSNGKITSGTAKGDAVSVYFNTSVKESVSATVSKKFSSNTIKVTLNASNATNLTYSLSNGKNGSFVDGDSLTIGGDMEIGDSVTLTVKGTGAESGEALEFTATYTKVEVQANTIYATKPSGWSKMYAYVYTGDGATAKNNAAWPGVEMTAMAAADSCAKAGTYKYEVPDLGEGTYRVIFSNGSGSQMPGASQPGFEFSGKVSWDGSSASLTAITCTATPPVIKTADITFSATADLKTGETLYAVGDWGQGKGKTWNRAGGVKLAKNGNAYTGTTTMAKGQAITARLIKVDANGKTTWDEIGDVKATADKTKTVDLKWTNAVENTVDITINAAADLKTGETLYAVGDWGQGKGKTWTRAGGVKLARYGNAYTGTTKVGKGNAITFRLIKVDANGKTTWDSAKDRKSKADKTKALGVSWTSGKVNEDGTIPDDSAISISGKGVADGKLSIQKGNLAELYVIGTQDATPSDAVWWSDGAAVAVSGTGTVYGVQTGTAKVNVKVGNQTATITITVK
ncbi:alpha-amylase family glycosyl hydrolase [Bifidobacterium pseudocatenulatum]|uniref:alpha-amylase family glycosyl hydrolase n=1 Tax=Bifidobacterium pseudocatenulatum TaxID=28026 RepID=UPI001CFF4407|nr:alpha-amylase family glycosyl hydrolase [Bifidobacterium pseudocatenulatum]MCB4909407.1 starch-binding protein [Bifidobacterium pseudocatenulatum]